MHHMDKALCLEHIGYFRAPRSRDIRPRQIPEGKEYVELLTGGRVLFDDGSGERERGAGTLFWHIPGDYTVHKNVPEDPYECFTAAFNIEPPHRRIAPRMTQWGDVIELGTFVESMLRAFRDERIDRGLLGRHVHSRLLWEAHLSERRKEAELMPSPIVKALSMIECGFREDLDVDRMSLRCGVSVPYLHALFKKHLGESPHQRLLSRRLQEAKGLLSGSELNLKEVASSCGFASVEHFCRLFKARFGATPTQYRGTHTLDAIFKNSPSSGIKQSGSGAKRKPDGEPPQDGCLG